MQKLSTIYRLYLLALLYSRIFDLKCYPFCLQMPLGDLEQISNIQGIKKEYSPATRDLVLCMFWPNYQHRENPRLARIPACVFHTEIETLFELSVIPSEHVGRFPTKLLEIGVNSNENDVLSIFKLHAEAFHKNIEPPTHNLYLRSTSYRFFRKVDQPYFLRCNPP